ncbi:TIGR03826 family flagellar region protein [Bacillus massiliigorillae]|uniref:TIGR03826 family flagellar region protein n=1 Tax=Bacillus massiliigorillae TaxID=1243664 RepID=UPI0003A809E1|nr:TIGR03826 family flagellar region protein [Bacillus massiliigorillae]
MGDVSNCPKCRAIFLRTKFRDVCDKCFKEEEKIFEEVYQYIRKKENRKAMINQVVEDTGVDEDLLIKFIKMGKLKLSQFPNLGYKCESCGSFIQEGSLCATCTNNMRKQLKTYNQEEKRKAELIEKEKKVTFYTKNEE